MALRQLACLKAPSPVPARLVRAEPVEECPHGAKDEECRRSHLGPKADKPGDERLTTLVHQATPFVAVGAGILVLIKPQLLNFVVAACLILIGVVGLNGLYHFVR